MIAKLEEFLAAPILLEYYLILSLILVTLGIIGIVFNKRNLIMLLLCFELVLLGVNIMFISFSHVLGDLNGQIFALFIMSIAAAEASLGLAIIVAYYRKRNNLDLNEIDKLKE